jgi:hypothetical protein
MNIQDTPLQNVEVNTIEQTTSMYDDTPLNDTTGIGESLTSSIEHVEKQREVIAEEQRLENIDNASVGDKYFGMSSTFDGSDIGGVIDWFKYDKGYFQEKDEKFLNGFNKNTEDMVLKNFSLNESSRPYIQEAKNYEHLISLATKEQLRTEALKNVMNVYSDTENLVSNLLVGLATDPSVVLTGGASGLIRGSAILARSSKVTKALSSIAKVEETGKALKVSSQAEQMASSTIKTLTDKAQQQARTQAALMVVNDMKEGLAKAVVGSSIAYGAVLGATQEDTSMIEGLLAYGLLSPIDYKIINGIKVLDIAPRTIGIGKDTVDSMHENTLRIGRNSNKNDLTIIPKSSSEYLKPFKVTQDELVKIEHKINSIKNISNIEKEELKNAIRARLRVSNLSGFKNLTLKIKSIQDDIKKIENSNTDIDNGYNFTGVHGGDYEWGEIPRDTKEAIMASDDWYDEMNNVLDNIDLSNSRILTLEDELSNIKDSGLKGRELVNAKEKIRYEIQSKKEEVSELSKKEELLNRNQPKKLISRYDSVAGQDVTYIDNDGRWQYDSHGYSTRERKYLHVVEGVLHKPVVINEDTLADVEKLLEKLGITDERKIKELLEKEGYDGIIINMKMDIDAGAEIGKDGIPTGVHKNPLVQNMYDKGGIMRDLLQNQVIVFDAKKSTKLKKTYNRLSIDDSKIKDLVPNIGISKIVTSNTKNVKKIEAKKIENYHANAKKLSIAHTLVDDIHDIGRDIEVSISGFNKTLKEVGTSGKAYDDIVDDVLSIYKSLKDTGYLSNSAYNKLITHRKNGAKFINPKIEINHTVKKNGESFAEVKINGKIVAVLGASALAASGLGAYDGGDLVSDSGNIIGLAILSLFLGAGVRQALKSRAVRKALEESEGIVNKSKAFDDTRSIRASIGEFFNSSRNGLMETIDPILKNTTGAVHDLAKIMYFNPLDQTAKTIETTKRIFAKSKSEGLEKELRATFSSWLKNTDNSTIDNISSMFTDISLRAKYNKMVWEHMTMGKHSDNIDVVNGAKNVDKYNKQVRKDMKESGVANADKMIHAEDGLYYVPRINKGLEFANKITGISDISKKGLINTFAKMLVNTPDARKMIVAEEYINNMIKRNINPSKTFSKDARESIKKELSIKGLSEDEIDEVISSISGEYGRTKARLFMDYSKFGTFKADINGVSIPITIDDIFITDISSCSNTLFNQAGGHVAFATNGFKSVDDAISIVNDANILENHRAILLNDIGAMIGIPAIDYSQTANVVFKNLGNMATGSMMKLSTISLMSEGIIYIANTLRQSGLIDGMKNLSNSVRKFGDDSFIASDIPFGKDGLGLGQSKYGATYGQFRTFDEFSNQHSGIGKFTRFTEMWRDFTLHTLPFSRTSDFLAKANLQDVLDRLYKHFSGELPLKDHELSAFPITDRMREYLMKSMSLNKEGHVKFFDYTTESFGLKDEFKNLIDNMMMKRMNASTMGTTGAFVRQSAVGVGMSAMLKYPMSAYANLGGFLGRGAMQGDAFAMTQIALWFQAGIVQAIIRNEIQGKDYDDNDLIIAGLSNMPQYGIIGTITGLGESPTSNMAADITNILDIYSYVNK